MIIRKIKGKSEGYSFLKFLIQRMPGENEEVREKVRSIVQEVRSGGVSSVLKLREKYEGVSALDRLTWDLKSLTELAKECTPKVKNAIEISIQRVRAYHQIQKEDDKVLHEGKSFLGSRVQPLDSAALYVPGGKAFYPSSVIMSAVPAQVAGVGRVGIFTPARSLADPVFAATVLALNISEIHAVGGAQAVATAAFGVESIPRFDKIVGPGNIYVASAKQMLAGRIGIDGFAGPSEILILGDGSSSPNWIAVDLLAQAEHDEDASCVFVTTSDEEANNVEKSLAQIISQLKDREPIARASLERWGAIIVVQDRSELLEFANAIHPEHLHLHTSCALTLEGQEFWKKEVGGVGAIFFGKYTSESFGDYLAGPSHVLPTAGTARFSSPLGVYDFQRRSSLIYFTPQLAQDLSDITADFADAEKLWAHAISAKMRK